MDDCETLDLGYFYMNLNSSDMDIFNFSNNFCDGRLLNRKKGQPPIHELALQIHKRIITVVMNKNKMGTCHCHVFFI